MVELPFLSRVATRTCALALYFPGQSRVDRICWFEGLMSAEKNKQGKGVHGEVR